MAPQRLWPNSGRGVSTSENTVACPAVAGVGGAGGPLAFLPHPCSPEGTLHTFLHTYCVQVTQQQQRPHLHVTTQWGGSPVGVIPPPESGGVVGGRAHPARLSWGSLCPSPRPLLGPNSGSPSSPLPETAFAVVFWAEGGPGRCASSVWLHPGQVLQLNHCLQC